MWADTDSVKMIDEDAFKLGMDTKLFIFLHVYPVLNQYCNCTPDNK